MMNLYWKFNEEMLQVQVNHEHQEVWFWWPARYVAFAAVSVFCLPIMTCWPWHLTVSLPLPSLLHEVTIFKSVWLSLTIKFGDGYDHLWVRSISCLGFVRPGNSEIWRDIKMVPPHSLCITCVLDMNFFYFSLTGYKVVIGYSSWPLEIGSCDLDLEMVSWVVLAVDVLNTVSSVWSTSRTCRLRWIAWV